MYALLGPEAIDALHEERRSRLVLRRRTDGVDGGDGGDWGGRLARGAEL